MSASTSRTRFFVDADHGSWSLARLAAILGILALGAVIALGPLRWVAAGILGAIALLAILLRPMLAIYLLAFAIPFGSLRQVSAAGINVGAVEVLTAVIAVAWAARMMAERSIRIEWPSLALPLFLLLLAMSYSLAVTTSLAQSLKEIAKWLEVMVIYLFLANNLDKRSSQILVISLLTAASLEALLGLYQFFRGVGPEGFLLMGRFMRAFGTFQQPNPFAGYLGLSLPLAIGVLASNWKGLWQGGQARAVLDRALPWIALTSAALMGAALIASWSRGGWLGFAAAGGVMVFYLSRRALMLALGVTAALSLILLAGGLDYVPPSIVQRVTDTIPYLSGVDIQSVEVDDANWSLLERMAHWQAAWAMFGDHPWLGVGIGNYATLYPHYALSRWQDPLGHAHNYYLNIAAEAGLVGLSAYLLFWIACSQQVLAGLRRARGIWRGLVLAALGVFVHLSVHNGFDNLYVHGMHLMVAFALGLLHMATTQERGGASCASA